MKRFAFPAVVAIALAVRVFLFSPGLTPDSQRFLTQARHLLGHEGYLSPGGDLDTALPPGYPLFLAALLPIGSLAVIRAVQVVLSALAAALIFAALRPAGERVAAAGGLVFAVHPWIAAASGTILSETVGAFTCALLIYLLSRIETGRSNGFAFGAVSVALLMISPGAMFLSFALFLRVLWLRRKSPASIGATILGALLVMIPWQAHVLAARNTLAPSVFVWDFQHDTGKWTRTWLRRERELLFRWHPRDLDRAPERAFRSAAERAQLTAVARHGSDADLAATLRATGERHAAENPMRFHVALPAIRAGMLWLDMPQLSHVQMEYVARVGLSDWKELGPKRALLRLGKSVLSTLAWLFYVGVPLVYTVIALRRRRAVPLLILFGIAAYTLITAYFGEIEARRNIVFYPALLFIPFYPRRQD